MSETREVNVSSNHARERLDRFLAAELGISRSRAQHLIREGSVTVDGKSCTPHDAVRAGMNIRIVFPDILRTHETLQPVVLAETAEYFILEKPSGLLTHGTPQGGETTLVDWLLDHDPRIREVGESGRPGIVHRLDRDVSGVMIVARTPEFFEHIQNEFRARRVEKTYTALVHGLMEKDEGEIRFPLARSERKHGRMAARPIGGEGRDAMTRYRVRERFLHATLLTVMIDTGRTHQIRAHCYALGHPIVGDRLYRHKRPVKGLELSRPFLHATKVRFHNLQGEIREYRSALPSDLQLVLRRLQPLSQRTD
jgi:23S rRNA pseudouridine1911/1915/1917 synthase